MSVHSWIRALLPGSPAAPLPPPHFHMESQTEHAFPERTDGEIVGASGFGPRLQTASVVLGSLHLGEKFGTKAERHEREAALKG